MDLNSVVSDLTDTDFSSVIEIKLNALMTTMENKMNAVTKDELKEVCINKNLPVKSKSTKQELKLLLSENYNEYYLGIKSLSIPKLKEICRDEKIIGFSSLKKDELIILILNQYVNSLEPIQQSQQSKQIKDDEEKQQVTHVQIQENDQLSNNVFMPNQPIDKTSKSKKTKSNTNTNTNNVLPDNDSDTLTQTLHIDNEIAKLMSIKEKLEKERIEKERIEKERLEKERIEKERLEKERLEKERLEKERSEKKKIVIPKAVKTTVWDTYIGHDIVKHKCLCCKRSYIKNTDFHVGHVLSEKDGGTLEIQNLRPICAPCNYSMGTENMVEFIKKYGYYL